MITAAEALQLPSAGISDTDITDVRAMVEIVDKHIRTHMTFGGPTPLEVSFRHLSKTAVQVLCYVMKHFKWTINANLIAEQPRFQGAQPTPHHWILQFAPTVEVYDELLADFDISPRLM